jgi:hypothetical protein
MAIKERKKRQPMRELSSLEAAYFGLQGVDLAPQLAVGAADQDPVPNAVYQEWKVTHQRLHSSGQENAPEARGADEQADTPPAWWVKSGFQVVRGRGNEAAQEGITRGSEDGEQGAE